MDEIGYFLFYGAVCRSLGVFCFVSAFRRSRSRSGCGSLGVLLGVLERRVIWLGGR